ncbi:hypothetical protein AMTR_s00045p00019160 [Amborella trichopoda]|uniref:Uncharacterized protein n=1 Tax=Amborella trichopoda TaxID=13333 RepID=W1P1Y5_AMBTC|nr:hypothetical protein AMTR_s00045p00019160 [Amborella trichopoda]
MAAASIVERKRSTFVPVKERKICILSKRENIKRLWKNTEEGTSGKEKDAVVLFLTDHQSIKRIRGLLCFAYISVQSLNVHLCNSDMQERVGKCLARKERSKKAYASILTSTTSLGSLFNKVYHIANRGANQRLPLPVHWFLSPLATLDAAESIDVARSGHFFLLGVEAMSALCSENPSSPILHVPLVWKLHALSMVFLKRNDILEETQTRDTFKTSQDMYGQRLDKLRQRKPEVVPENEKSSGVYSREILYFVKEVHESYGSFIEIPFEQFSAVSYLASN